MQMKMGVFACAAFAALALAAPEASAKPRITEKTRYYTISGKTGLALMQDMNRRGPRQGFLSKAIAQTRYTTNFRGDMVHEHGVCSVSGGGVDLAITYVYPKPRGKVTAALAKRWRAFAAQTVRHEEEHGRLARAMAAELDRFIRDFAMRDGRSCRKAEARMRRDTNRIYKRYTKLQNEFDQREHRAGGAVEKSILRLIGKRG